MVTKHPAGSPREYLEPFFKRYRRLFWFDGILAGLHLPLLAWLLTRPAILADVPIRIGWPTTLIHVSLALVGIVANFLLLRRHPFGPLAGYLKSAYAVGVRIFILCFALLRLGLSWPEVLEPSAPLAALLLLIAGYQSFYAWCIHLNIKWGEKLRIAESEADSSTNGMVPQCGDAV